MTRRIYIVSCLDAMIDENKPLFQPGEPVLKQIREMLGGISQEEFARRIGVSVTTINRWEKGRHPTTLTIEQVKKLDLELQSVGLSWQNLPDTLGPYESA